MPQPPTHDDIVRLFGPLSDHTIIEILNVKPKYSELEEVAMLLAQEDDVMGDLRRPLVGGTAHVYDILMRAEDYPDDQDRER